MYFFQSALQEKLSTNEQNLQTQAKNNQEKIEALHKQLQKSKTLSQVNGNDKLKWAGWKITTLRIPSPLHVHR